MSARRPPSFLRLLRRSPHVWFGAFFILAACFVVFAAIEEWTKARRVRREGVEARAEIAARAIDPARREGNRRTRYLVTYRFTTATGEPVERTEEVDVETWERLREGETASITYLPSIPADAAAATPAAWFVPLILAGAGLLAALIGSLIALPGLRRMGLVRRLHREGEAAAGTVTAVWATGVVVNRVRQWRLRYELHDRAGRRFEGESDLLSPAEALRWNPGARGEVLLDPLRPEESIWLGTLASDEPASTVSSGERPPASAEPTPAPAPAPARRRLPAPLRLAGQIVIALVLVFIAAVIAEVPPVKDLLARITRDRTRLVWPVGAVLSLGFLLFLGGILSLLLDQGEPMSPTDIEDQRRTVREASRPAAWRASAYRFRGTAAGAQGADEFTFRELKDAWRSGRVWREPRWRRRLVITVGALSMSTGILGLFVVIGPPWVQVLVGGAFLYAAVMITRGFWKA